MRRRFIGWRLRSSSAPPPSVSTSSSRLWSAKTRRRHRRRRWRHRRRRWRHVRPTSASWRAACSPPVAASSNTCRCAPRLFTTRSASFCLNSWPTFSPYLYNRVWSELTCCSSFSHLRLACSRLSAHIQPSVNNPDTKGAANSVVVSIYNGHELS